MGLVDFPSPLYVPIMMAGDHEVERCGDVVDNYRRGATLKAAGGWRCSSRDAGKILAGRDVIPGDIRHADHW